MRQRIVWRLAAVLIAVLATPAWAVVRNWNDASDNWSNGAAWAPVGVPEAGDAVNIVFADDVARTVTYDYTGPPITIGPLKIDMTGAGTNASELSMGANLLTVSGGEIVGENGRGALNQGGGVHHVDTLTIGANAGSTGAMSLSSGTLVSSVGTVVGDSGAGSFSQTSGVHTSTGPISIGAMAGSNGAYTLNSGTTNAASVYVGGRPAGAGGTGVLTVSGSNASLNVLGTITVYNTPGSVLNLQSSGTITTGGINLGGSPSLFNWSSGTLTITNDVTWDSGAAANSTSTIFGSSLSLSTSKTLKVIGNETIGGSGSFSLSVGNGVHTVTGNITVKPGGNISVNSVGNPAGTLSYSNLTLAGGSIGSSFRNGSNFIYQSGTITGTFVNDGTIAFGPTMTISGPFTNNAAMTVAGNQTFTATSGIANAGTFTVAGGTIGGGQFTNSLSGTLIAHGTFNSSITNQGTLIVDGVLNYGSTSTNTGIVQGAGSVTSTSQTTFNNNSGGVINATTPGGTLSFSSLANNAGAVINIGPTSTLAVGPSSSFVNSGIINLQGTGARLTGGTITNNGTIQGFGTITSKMATSNSGVTRASGGQLDFTDVGLINSSQAQLQVLSGSTMMFLQGLSSNSGLISLVGGAFDNNGKTLNNSGTINGHGTLRTGGLTNSNSRLISIGGGNMDVFGAVTNFGTVSIEGGRTAYFYGNVSGSGNFTGTGTAVFLANFSPGSSPASVQFGGNVSLSGATLVMELGGTTPGSEYDQIHVAGQLALGGTLSVSRINGFMPTPWTSFDLLDWGTLSGTFSSINLPTLAVGQWDTSQLYATGVLSVVLAGDFDKNGAVEGADYVVWRKGLGTIYTADDYDDWRAHYGEGPTTGSGSAAAVSSVPEPRVVAMMVVAAALVSAGETSLVGIRRGRRR